jgi:1,4-alpha-glucan branching enzyme
VITAFLPCLYAFSIEEKGRSLLDCTVTSCVLVSVTLSSSRHFPNAAAVASLSVSVPETGFHRELINTGGETYCGSNVGNFGGVHSEAREWMGREHSIVIHLPPLATVAFKLEW